MNVPAELDKIEARLSPNARFAAWLQHESAGDELVASRLRNGGARLDIYMIWRPTNLFCNALKDAVGLFYMMVSVQIARLEMLPLALCMANRADNVASYLDYLENQRPDGRDDDPDDDLGVRFSSKVEALRPAYIRNIALWCRAWDAFCADERIDPQAALHAIGCPVVDELAPYEDEIEAYEPNPEDADEIDERREHMLSMYARYLDRMTAQPYDRGQVPLRPRRAPREELDVAGAADELHDDLSYLDDFAAAAALINREEVLLTPVPSNPDLDADDDQDGCA
jgi:hypothetical protein